MQPARTAEAISAADQRAGGWRLKVWSGLPVRKETVRRIMEVMQVLWWLVKKKEGGGGW